MRTALKLLFVMASRFRRVAPGDVLLDESRNYLVDESGNRLVG